MAPYARERASVRATLRAKGGPGVLRKATRGALDERTDTTLGDATTEYTAYAVWPAGQPGRNMAPGGMVLAGAEMIILAAAELPDGVEPEPNDAWIQDGSTYRIGAPVACVRPDGVTPILYRCPVRA